MCAPRSESLKAHVLASGRAVVQDVEARKDPVALVQALLDLRDKYGGILEAAFGDDKDFHRALKEAFETIMNDDGGAGERWGAGAAAGPGVGSGKNVCAEFLSVYVDEHMKGLFRGETEAGIDEKLNKVRADACIAAPHGPVSSCLTT